jgi:hypothetical protein
MFWKREYVNVRLKRPHRVAPALAVELQANTRDFAVITVCFNALNEFKHGVFALAPDDDVSNFQTLFRRNCGMNPAKHKQF